MKRRILIVEDDLISRLVMTGNLSNIGQSDVAMDGEEAVEAVRLALSEHRPYDIICLDIMMPQMNGQEALRLIRKLEGEAGIKPGLGARIIMTTGRSDLKTVKESYMQECDAFLVKPVKKERLLAELAKLEII